MNKEVIEKVLGIAQEKFGSENQLRMLQEECAELIVAVSKYFRYNTTEELIEEGVDVELMLAQLKLLLKSPLAWKKMRQKKLERLLKLLE